MTHIHRRMNEAKTAFQQERQRSRFISDQYPDIASIVIRMKYRSEGSAFMKRTVNFYPKDHAFFKMNCLGQGCEAGGLNLTRVITSMIRNRHRSIKGDVRCSHKDPDVVHADMSYVISIKYV